MSARVTELCSDGLCLQEGEVTFKMPDNGIRLVLCRECHAELRRQVAASSLPIEELDIRPIARPS